MKMTAISRKTTRAWMATTILMTKLMKLKLHTKPKCPRAHLLGSALVTVGKPLVTASPSEQLARLSAPCALLAQKESNLLELRLCGFHPRHKRLWRLCSLCFSFEAGCCMTFGRQLSPQCYSNCK